MAVIFVILGDRFDLEYVVLLTMAYQLTLDVSVMPLKLVRKCAYDPHLKVTFYFILNQSGGILIS